MSAKHELEMKNLIYLLELLCFLIYIRVQINNLLFQLIFITCKRHHAFLANLLRMILY